MQSVPASPRPTLVIRLLWTPPAQKSIQSRRKPQPRPGFGGPSFAGGWASSHSASTRIDLDGTFIYCLTSGAIHECSNEVTLDRRGSQTWANAGRPDAPGWRRRSARGAKPCVRGASRWEDWRSTASSASGRRGGSRPRRTPGRAKACILIFQWGGPSQLDTWDPKPDAPADVRGPFRAIETSVPGVRIGEHFPMLAARAHRLAIIRSMGHDDLAHLSSVHRLQTGHLAPRPKSDADGPSPADWPHLGSVVAKVRPRGGVLPPSVILPWTVAHPAAPGGKAPGQHAGWLGKAHDPFLVEGDPNAPGFRVGGLGLPEGVSIDRLRHRRRMLGEVGESPGARRPAGRRAAGTASRPGRSTRSARPRRGGRSTSSGKTLGCATATAGTSTASAC